MESGVQTARTFRIFVSSTFSDLKVERSALQERVFPRLRELCAQHGARFQAIDLRREVAGTGDRVSAGGLRRTAEGDPVCGWTPPSRLTHILETQITAGGPGRQNAGQSVCCRAASPLVGVLEAELTTKSRKSCALTWSCS